MDNFEKIEHVFRNISTVDISRSEIDGVTTLVLGGIVEIIDNPGSPMTMVIGGQRKVYMHLGTLIKAAAHHLLDKLAIDPILEKLEHN